MSVDSNESVAEEPLSNQVLSKGEFEALTDLYWDHDWLLKKSRAVASLFQLCADEAQSRLVRVLLKRFEYVSANRYVDLLKQMRDYIIGDLGCKPTTTRIVAANDGSHADSSQAVLYNLKPLFASYEGWTGSNFVSQLTAAAHKEIQSGDTVVLVDDYVGTGKQIYGRTSWMLKQLNRRSCCPSHIVLCSVARQLYNKKNLYDIFERMYSPIVLRRGIADFHDASEAEGLREMMRALESKLSPTIGRSHLPSLGYGQSEALFGSDVGNAPNNVFPLFWWKMLASGLPRPTLFERLGG